MNLAQAPVRRPAPHIVGPQLALRRVVVTPSSTTRPVHLENPLAARAGRHAVSQLKELVREPRLLPGGVGVLVDTSTSKRFRALRLPETGSF
jgi:hypothetical protein